MNKAKLDKMAREDIRKYGKGEPSEKEREFLRILKDAGVDWGKRTGV